MSQVKGDEEIITQQAQRRLESGENFVPEENMRYTMLTSILGKLPARISNNFTARLQALEQLDVKE
jgi:hypothetical protein